MASNRIAAAGEGESRMTGVTHGYSSDCGMNSSGTSRRQTRGYAGPSDFTSQSARERSRGKQTALRLHGFNRGGLTQGFSIPGNSQGQVGLEL